MNEFLETVFAVVTAIYLVGFFKGVGIGIKKWRFGRAVRRSVEESAVKQPGVVPFPGQSRLVERVKEEEAFVNGERFGFYPNVDSDGDIVTSSRGGSDED